jgi:hypothetical protein
MECINAVRPQLWRSRGRDLLRPITYLDVDGTIAPTYGEKKDRPLIHRYLGVYAPLIVPLWNTKELVYPVNRPGNVPSHTDATEWIDRAIAHVGSYAPRVCVRGDTDFSLTHHFDRWSGNRWSGGPKYETLTGTQRERFQPNDKARIVEERRYLKLKLHHEHVAEFR